MIGKQTNAKSISVLSIMALVLLSTFTIIPVDAVDGEKLEWAKRARNLTEKLMLNVKESNVHPAFKRLALVYLQVAVREIDEAIGHIVVTDTIPANMHLMRARLYIQKFFRLINAFTLTKADPELATEWQLWAMIIIEVLTRAIEIPTDGVV